jgi:hypothetical protein
MRPVHKPPPPVPLRKPRGPDQRAIDILRTALQDTIGCYCSICEMPVYVGNHVMSKGKSRLAGTPPLEQWDDFLLGCEYCQLQRSTDADDGSAYLWPDVDHTFSLDDSSPFVHVLREVPFTLTDEHDAVLSTSTARLGIITANPASPDAERARRTIELFQLNTPFYDEESNTFRANRDLIAYDRRVELRSRAWYLAAEAIRTLREAEALEGRGAYFDGALTVYSNVAQQNGFWSVWMTAIWKAFGEPELLRRMLLEITDRRFRVVGGFQTYPDGGKPPWKIFTGTAVDRLSI